jgi:hypothetical protein
MDVSFLNRSSDGISNFIYVLTGAHISKSFKALIMMTMCEDEGRLVLPQKSCELKQCRFDAFDVFSQGLTVCCNLRQSVKYLRCHEESTKPFRLTL